MHEISLEKYDIRTDLVIEQNNLQGTKKETIKDENYQIERLNKEEKKYTSISFEDITDKDNFKVIEDILIKELKLIINDLNIKKDDLVLIIGQGNSKYC